MPQKESQKNIIIKGARQHNLKNINLVLPREKMIVITGLSGSGKSSLAFDTIYAEGQRRYVESLSAYARQFLEMSQKPDVDQIDGLSPAISIEQKTTSKNPRSHVGTVTEIYDYLRLLFARIGVPYSPATGLPIESQSVAQMASKLAKLEKGTKIYLLAPMVRGRKGEYKAQLLQWQKLGFSRVKIDGTFYEIEEAPHLDKNYKHNIDLVVDRLVMDGKKTSRLIDGLELALKQADGIAIAELADTKIKSKPRSNDNAERILFSQKFACPVSGFTIEEIEPRIFSFNAPHGACLECDGLGTEFYIDPQAVVPADDKTILEGAIAPWFRTNGGRMAKRTANYYLHILKGLAKHFGFSLNTSWKKLSAKHKEIILYGTDEEITYTLTTRHRTYKVKKPYEGVIPNLERRYKETDSNWMREEIERYQSITQCASCKGHRLKDESLAVKINKKHIGEVTSLSIKEALIWFHSLEKNLTPRQRKIGKLILKEIKTRLRFLDDVGLNYLTLSRHAGTLSGGESQRIRLASQIGAGLTGVLYVLDEPSIGLHQRDNKRLLNSLQHLCDLGNTVLVVEHDEEAILSADHIVDIGPGAGIHGGEVVACGGVEKIKREKKSLTGQYLSKQLKIAVPKTRRKPQKGKTIKILGAKGNNLNNINATFPLKTFICLTGVSGSGKSTLLLDTFYKAMARQLTGARALPAAHSRIRGGEQIDKVINIDQSPIGRTPRSNPATYTGTFTPIREWFAGLPESKARGYLPGRFSFNVKGGRCEICQGDGVLRIEMHFLPDVYVECDECRGKRYNEATLEIKYKGKNIADVLDMTSQEAREFFKHVPAIFDKLTTICRVGLGYIHLGQQATTLSGGEAQRVKLAKELSKRATGKTIYILDEPTTGLHFHDVAKLLEILHELVDAGNSVIVIEHNLDVIKTADWIIDLGPDGGDKGGKVIASGTPENIAKVKESYTGRFLKAVLKG